MHEKLFTINPIHTKHNTINMAELPSEIILEILSRTLVKSLARFRCVSKLWCEYIDDHTHFARMHGERSVEEPKPIIMFRQKPNFLRILSLPIDESIDCSTTLFEEAKEDPIVEFKYMQMLYVSPETRIQGCSNGWVYMSINYDSKLTSTVLVNPLRKECYELPPIMHSAPRPDSYGLGFDASTNTFKMVSLLFNNNRKYLNYIGDTRKNLFTMVYVLGTDSSWREIPQIPSSPVTGNAIFAHGYLHWLSYYDGYMQTDRDEAKRVIRFDVSKEEFGSIDIPKKKRDRVRYQLVDLHGEVGLVYHYLYISIEVWVLKQKEWVMHCQFRQHFFPRGVIRVLGRFNKEGDILFANGDEYSGKYRLFIYRLKSGVMDKANTFDCREAAILMYPVSLSSVRPININA